MWIWKGVGSKDKKPKREKGEWIQDWVMVVEVVSFDNFNEKKRKI